MPLCTITLSANAGISVVFNGIRILVDALHTKKVEGFSTVSSRQWETMQHLPAFQNPDFVCYTHCHSDHYSKKLTQEAKQLWPNSKLILPEREFNGQFCLSGRETAFYYQNTSFRFLEIPHEGRNFSSIPHYVLLLSNGVSQVLITGDCAVASPALKEALHGTYPDLVILDFPWVTLSRGRAFIQKILCPKHLLVYHLPFSQDDVFGYRNAAFQALELLHHPDARLLWEPFQAESF